MRTSTVEKPATKLLIALDLAGFGLIAWAAYKLFKPQPRPAKSPAEPAGTGTGTKDLLPSGIVITTEKPPELPPQPPIVPILPQLQPGESFIGPWTSLALASDWGRNHSLVPFRVAQDSIGRWWVLTTSFTQEF